MEPNNNMYRVGDYVYFETQPGAPYQIRRIEELNKNPSSSQGAVQAKVTCFFRRRDLPNSLLKIADQAERQSQIVSKARKTLMASKEGISINSGGTVIAATTNGEAGVPKENGLDATGPTSRNSSTEPDGTKKENTEDNDEAGSYGHHSHKRSYGFAGLPTGAQKLGAEQLHELRQRELFLSRIVELLPANQIRGKCTVVILNEVETCDMYLDRKHEDAFFYSLVYDPSNQTLLADKGRIELGERHQAIIPELVEDKNKEKADEKEGKKGEEEEKMQIDDEPVSFTTQQKEEEMEGMKKKAGGGVECTERENLVYHPNHSLSDAEIDQFLLIARAVGTFSRALDTSSSIKLPTLHQTASAASRDITLLHAMALLHHANYDLGQASKYLVPLDDKQNYYPLEADKLTGNNTSLVGGPILCRDQLEEWSASESTLFEDAIEKYGKDFHDIRHDCLPWKSMRDIVEYYYMWKTTSRYADLQKAKHAEQVNKVNQVYIPPHKKLDKDPNLIGTSAVVSKSSGGGQIGCESCGTNPMDAAPTMFWYFWGPAQQFPVCGECWTVWKKRGGLKKPHSFDTFDLENGNNDGRSGGQGGNRMGGNATGRNGLPQQVLPRGTAGQILIGQKGRVAFFLNSTLETRVARRMAPKTVFNVRKAARAPFHDIDHKGVQDFYFGRPINDVLQMARQVMKRGILTEGTIKHLSKLHKKKMAEMAAEQQNGGGKK